MGDGGGPRLNDKRVFKMVAKSFAGAMEFGDKLIADGTICEEGQKRNAGVKKRVYTKKEGSMFIHYKNKNTASLTAELRAKQDGPVTSKAVSKLAKEKYDALTEDEAKVWVASYLQSEAVHAAARAAEAAKAAAPAAQVAAGPRGGMGGGGRVHTLREQQLQLREQQRQLEMDS